MDVVAEGAPHAPFHQAVQGHRLVHEAVVVGRNCSSNVRIVFDAVLRKAIHDDLAK
jgi:hypothetical protein